MWLHQWAVALHASSAQGPNGRGQPRRSPLDWTVQDMPGGNKCLLCSGRHLSSQLMSSATSRSGEMQVSPYRPTGFLQMNKFSHPSAKRCLSRLAIPGRDSFSFFFFKILFICFEREGEGGRQRGKETLMGERYTDQLPLACPQPGTWLETQACALTRN